MIARLNMWLFLLVMLTNINVRAQFEGYITISGFVLDKETGEPLSYASIGVRNQGLGTITNEIGQFVLRVPERFSNDTIMVSYLGYIGYSNVISKIENQSN